jgi:hypothetical protein
MIEAETIQMGAGIAASTAMIVLARFVVSRACRSMPVRAASAGETEQRDVRVDCPHPRFRMIVCAVNACRSPAERETR